MDIGVLVQIELIVESQFDSTKVDNPIWQKDLEREITALKKQLDLEMEKKELFTLEEAAKGDLIFDSQFGARYALWRDGTIQLRKGIYLSLTKEMTKNEVYQVINKINAQPLKFFGGRKRDKKNSRKR